RVVVFAPPVRIPRRAVTGRGAAGAHAGQAQSGVPTGRDGRVRADVHVLAVGAHGVLRIGHDRVLAVAAVDLVGDAVAQGDLVVAGAQLDLLATWAPSGDRCRQRGASQVELVGAVREVDHRAQDAGLRTPDQTRVGQ